jgi:hypothetical protein
VSSSNWIRPLVLAASCLIIGFVGGWALADVGGDGAALPDASVDVTVEEAAPKTTSVEQPEEAAAPARDSVAVSVLNGTTRAGYAATTATALKALGYTQVTSGNTPTQAGPTVVYFVEGAKPAADRLAKDLQTTAVKPIAGTPLEESAAGTDLVVVLGT